MQRLQNRTEDRELFRCGSSVLSAAYLWERLDTLNLRRQQEPIIELIVCHLPTIRSFRGRNLKCQGRRFIRAWDMGSPSLDRSAVSEHHPNELRTGGVFLKLTARPSSAGGGGSR